MAAKRNAILSKGSVYYIELSRGGEREHVAIRDKQIRLLGKPVEGKQRFQTGLGHTAFTNLTNVRKAV